MKLRRRLNIVCIASEKGLQNSKIVITTTKADFPNYFLSSFTFLFYAYILYLHSQEYNYKFV